MAKFDGFKVVCTNCDNDDQNFIECIGDYDGIVHLICRVCDNKAIDKKYDWLKD